MIPTSANPLDDEAQAAIAAAMQGRIDPFGGGDMTVPEALPPGPTAPAGPLPMDVAPAAPVGMPAQAPRPPSHRQSAQGHVDPELAFMAAFAQNPVLQRMVEESRNRPQRQQEFDAKSAAEGRASEKWQQERDIMAPLRAGKMQTDTALGAAKLEGKQAGTAYSKAMRQQGAELLQVHASRLAAAGLPGADQVSRMAQTIGSNENLSAEAVERMMKGVPGMTDKIIGDARAAAGQAETHRMNDARIGDMGEKNKQAWARIEAARARALEPKQSARERAVQAKNQDKLDDEIEKADWAKRMLIRVADQKKSVNTGPLAGRLQNAAQTVGLSSKEFDSMKQTLAQVSNRIIKELSGSAVTGNEWARMQDELANIMNDDDNFETKLANMVELTDSIKQQAINRYARAGAVPVNPTNTAKRVTAQAPAVNPGERAPPDATPGRSINDAQDGARAFSKSAGKYFVRKGGKWVPE